ANSGQGAAYVFVKPGGGWASGPETAKLTASDGAPGDELGQSVAVSGDGATVVAGAPATSNQGAAYVFAKPGGGWASGPETAKLTASDGAPGDDLGRSVAVSGDGSTIAAGAPDSSHGAAYVFVKPGGGWANASQTAKLTASDGAAGDRLG